jgi:hypothetical protein
VILLLRFVGVMNAAIWFGAAVFFTLGVAPAFFTPEMKRLFGDAYVGVIAQMVLGRFFALHYVCGLIALAHWIAEWFYLGRTLNRLTLGLLIGVLGFSLIGGLGLQPRLKEWHRTKYSRAESVTPEKRAQAARSFGLWHGVSSTMNLFVLAALGIYFWRLANPADAPRFVSAAKFRS